MWLVFVDVVLCMFSLCVDSCNLYHSQDKSQNVLLFRAKCLLPFLIPVISKAIVILRLFN